MSPRLIHEERHSAEHIVSKLDLAILAGGQEWEPPRLFGRPERTRWVARAIYRPLNAARHSKFRTGALPRCQQGVPGSEDASMCTQYPDT
eukprot:8390202-Pyramimonas_sp.AAC.1